VEQTVEVTGPLSKVQAEADQGRHDEVGNSDRHPARRERLGQGPGSRRRSGPASDRTRKSRLIRDDRTEVGHDMQVLIDVPAGWTLPSPACQEILNVLRAVARRASGETGDERMAG